MKKILSISGSPRRQGNSALMLKHFSDGTKSNNADLKEFVATDLDIKYCQGCLRCNILKRCSLQGDEWEMLSREIQDADVIAIASPVYFHHLPAPLKIIIDRFRSFVNVRITETGLIHTPWKEWKKEFVLMLSMGSSDDSDSKPVVDLFKYMTSILGPENNLHVISGTRLAVSRQVERSEKELGILYPKLNLDSKLVKADYKRNMELLKNCYDLGKELSLD